MHNFEGDITRNLLLGDITISPIYQYLEFLPDNIIHIKMHKDVPIEKLYIMYMSYVKWEHLSKCTLLLAEHHKENRTTKYTDASFLIKLNFLEFKLWIISQASADFDETKLIASQTILNNSLTLILNCKTLYNLSNFVFKSLIIADFLKFLYNFDNYEKPLSYFIK